jgi:hypothetical protein
MATVYTERDVARVEATGSLVEAAGGIAVAVLSIIALSRMGATATLPSIAVIILGAALLAEGGTIATEFSRMLSIATGGAMNTVEIGGGMTTEIFIGAGVLVLGVLALIGISPLILLPVAVIATGGMMLLTAGGVHRMNQIRIERGGTPENAQSLILAAGSGAAAFQILAAIAAIVLGILALSSAANTMTFTLVGLLILGASIVLSGTALTGSMMRLLTR